jgi:hypothetical protein
VDLSKVRNAEWLAGIAGLVLLISMFGFDWYEAVRPLGSIGIKAWDGQGLSGSLANLVILVAALSGIALVVLTATSRTVALPVAASALTAQLGAAAVVMVALRMIFQPGPNEFTELESGIFIALAGAALLTYGGWRAMEEEMAPYSPAAPPAADGSSSPDESPLAEPPADEPDLPGSPPSSSTV